MANCETLVRRNNLQDSESDGVTGARASAGRESQDSESDSDAGARASGLRQQLIQLGVTIEGDDLDTDPIRNQKEELGRAHTVRALLDVFHTVLSGAHAEELGVLEKFLMLHANVARSILEDRRRSLPSDIAEPIFEKTPSSS